MWDVSDIIFPDRVGNIFIYTTWKLGSSLSCKPIYNMLFTCVGQRGGGHGRITELSGHIIHQSTWHTVFREERSKIWQKGRYSSLNRSSTSRGSAACDKRCQYESTMAARCSCFVCLCCNILWCNWCIAAHFGQDTPEKEIFNLRESR